MIGSTKNARISPIRSAEKSSVQLGCAKAIRRPCQMNSGAAQEIAIHSAAASADVPANKPATDGRQRDASQRDPGLCGDIGMTLTA